MNNLLPGRSSRPRGRFRVSAIASLFIAMGMGCQRQSTPDGEREDPAPVSKTTQTGLVVFPSELQVGDAAVNDFVHVALSRIASGNYEAFRSLWTVRQEPLNRDEFEEGRQAVTKIEVRALEQVKLVGKKGSKNEDLETVYVLLVEVSLDPAQRAGQRNAQREIAMMLAREREEWRLARPPKAMREWIKSRAKGTDASESDQVPSSDTQTATSADPHQND